MILDKRGMTTDEVANHSWFHPRKHPLHTGVSLSLWKIFFPGNSQKSRSTSAWISANTFESLSQWRQHLFKMHCHWVQNVHPVQQSREQTPEDWNRKSAVSGDKVFQNATSGEESDAPSLLRFARASSGTLWREGRTGISVRCWATHRSQQLETNAKDKCQIAYYSCLMVPALTLPSEPPKLLKSSRKCTLKCWNILCVARPSPFVLSLQFIQTSLWSHQFAEDWCVTESVPT
jgi:hypothetical protein